MRKSKRKGEKATEIGYEEEEERRETANRMCVLRLQCWVKLLVSRNDVVIEVEKREKVSLSIECDVENFNEWVWNVCTWKVFF
jgi:hypothetical protein